MACGHTAGYVKQGASNLGTSVLVHIAGLWLLEQGPWRGEKGRKSIRKRKEMTDGWMVMRAWASPGSKCR